MPAFKPRRLLQRNIYPDDVHVVVAATKIAGPEQTKPRGRHSPARVFRKKATPCGSTSKAGTQCDQHVSVHRKVAGVHRAE